MDKRMKVTFYGTRGSVPVSGEAYHRFGGATTCVHVRCDGTEIFLDAGSGLVAAPPPESGQCAILLSHLHLDHVIGLPFFRGFYNDAGCVTIYGKGRGGTSVREALATLFSPPYWPVTLDELPAETRYRELEDSFMIDGVKVKTMEGNHPGGVTVYRIEFASKSLVFATDFEHDVHILPLLKDFAKDCDLLIYDGQYDDKEYDGHAGYGHSTPETGLRLAAEANARRLLFTHHAPDHDDATLKTWADNIKKQYPFADFARANDVLHI